MTQPSLDERYGRTPVRAARTRLVAIGAGVGVAVVVVAWGLWAGLLSPASAIETKDVGYEVVADDAVEVRWQLTVSADTAVTCALRAASEKHAVVGWKLVEVPPAEQHTRILTESLRTSEPAVVASVYRCWLPVGGAADAAASDLS